MSEEAQRRTFLKTLAIGAAAAGASALTPAVLPKADITPTARAAEPKTELSVARKGAPEALARAAVEGLGGMKRFVSKGDVVLVKPNIGWDRTPEQAANTNPEVVAAIVRMCLESGAKTVKVVDRTCNEARRCYKQSGIRDAVSAISDPAVSVEFIDERAFTDKTVKGPQSMQSWSYYKGVLEADKLINVPIAKHHNAARLTMALKNVMGVIGGNRGNIHADLDRNIAALNTAVKFDLIVLDAVRILVNNGPQGGKLTDVRKLDTVVAGTDPVAVDSFGATLFGITGMDVAHVRNAHALGLGEIDLGKVRIKEIALG